MPTTPPLPARNRREPGKTRGRIVVIATIVALLAIELASIVAPRAISQAAPSPNARRQFATAKASSQPSALPIRDVIIPAPEGSNGQVANPAGRAHLLFTRAMEARIRTSVQSSQDAASGGLLYNDGQVMVGSPVIYLVFYQPPGTSPFPAGYAAGIEAFFSHASGSSFASIWTQYTDSSGDGPDGTFTIGSPSDPAGGVYLDSATIPPSGSAGTQANLLTDGDIQNEVHAAHAANPSWLAPGTGVLYEVFLPPNTFEEIDPGEESFEQFCAYHASAFGSGGFYSYTLIPYGATSPSCSSNVAPNNLAIDASSNLAWHETSESVTDPYLGGYINANGEELADLCSSAFLPIAPNGANSAMNGRLALVQELWSNAAGGCDKRLGAPAGSALELNFPASVDFGPITPGATATPNLVIQNSTASEGGFPGNQANVFYVDLASGSNPAFSTPFAGGATIAAGGSLNIPLQIAAPATHGTLTGTVEIWTDDTSEAQPQTVPLVAEVGATPTPVQSATPSPSVTPSATASPGATPSPAPSSTPTPLPSASPSPTPSPVVEAGPFTVKGPHKLGVIADGTFGRIVILTVAAGKKLPGNKRAGALAGLSYSLVQTAIIQIVSASSTCVQGGGLAPGQKCAIAVTADATGPISFPLDKKGHPLKARIGGAVIVSASNVIPPQKDVETHTESVIVTPPRN